MVMSLPMSSDTMRCEARVIREAAERAAEQMKMVEDSIVEAHARIRATQHFVEDLDRHGSIDHSAAREILRHLLPKDEAAKLADRGGK